MHILRMLIDDNFRAEVVSHIKDAVVAKFRTGEFNKRQPKQREEAIGPITNKVGQFLSSKLVRNIFGQPRTKLNLRKAYGSITRQPIPSFEEIMLIAKKEKKVLINVDKGSAYFNEIGEILKKTGTSELAIVKTNLDPESEKESFHSIQGAHLMPVIHLDTQKKALKIMDLYIRNFSPEIMEISFQNDTSVFFRDYEKLAKRGVKTWYTCTSPHWCGGHDDELALDFNNKKDSWDWLINKGATVLQTDNPKELIEYLKLKGFKDQKNVLKE